MNFALTSHSEHPPTAETSFGHPDTLTPSVTVDRTVEPLKREKGRSVQSTKTQVEISLQVIKSVACMSFSE